MKDLVEYLVKSLVDKPEEVTITEIDSELATVIEVRVADGDAGKVIGKEGRIINAIRTLVKATAAKDLPEQQASKKRYNVEIITKEVSK